VLHAVAPALMVLLNYYRVLNLESGWTAAFGAGFFLLALFLAFTVHFVGIAVLHVLAKAFDGKGRFVEVLWLTGLYSIQLVIIAKAITLLTAVSGWMLLLVIPFYAYALFLDIKAIEVSHSLSTARSAAAAVLSYVLRAAFLFGVILVVYLLTVVLMVVGFFGANYYYAANATITQAGDATLYTNNDEGYSMTLPAGWETSMEDSMALMGYRYFSKGDKAYLMVNEGGVLGKLLTESYANVSEERCGMMQPETSYEYPTISTAYVEYGNARGCETRTISADDNIAQVSFNGICCEKTPLIVMAEVLNATEADINETLREYESVMSSITCG